ncbi:hypothetical protein LQW54_012589 [Pestalotiopsis sp. IQ-011]
MLSWNPDEFMINKKPTVPLLVQAFFNYDSSRAFNDSFAHQSPSFWLAIWDGGLSLQDSLAWGYTRLQLIDALATSSINLALNYREEPDKAAAYDYALTTISTIPQTRMTCDASSNEDYGPCHATIILQYPTFQRDVTTIEARMQWQDIAEAVGSWLSLFQIISWVSSGLGFAP